MTLFLFCLIEVMMSAEEHDTKGLGVCFFFSYSQGALKSFKLETQSYKECMESCADIFDRAFHFVAA